MEIVLFLSPNKLSLFPTKKRGCRQYYAINAKQILNTILKSVGNEFHSL